MGLLFGLENGKNTTYSHIKIGKMVHKDKKPGSIRWHAYKWNPEKVQVKFYEAPKQGEAPLHRDKPVRVRIRDQTLLIEWSGVQA